METYLIHTSGYQTAYNNATYNIQWSSIANVFDTSTGSYATCSQGSVQDNFSYPYTYLIVSDTDPVYYSGDLWTDPIDIKEITKVEMYFYSGCSDDNNGNLAGYMYHQLYINSTWTNEYTPGVPDGSSISYTARAYDVTSQRATWTLNDVKALRTRFVGLPRRHNTDDGKGTVTCTWDTVFYVGLLGYRITWTKRVSKSPIFTLSANF